MMEFCPKHPRETHARSAFHEGVYDIILLMSKHCHRRASYVRTYDRVLKHLLSQDQRTRSLIM